MNPAAAFGSRLRIASLDASAPVTPTLPTPTGPVYHSAGGQLVWDVTDPQRGLYTFDAPQAQGAVGFLAGRAVTLTNLALTFPADTAQFGAVTLQSQDGRPIAGSERLLLGVFTRVENTGMVWNADETSLAQWGTAPALIEPICFTITLTLSNTSDIEIWALDETGAPYHRSAHQVPAPGHVRFVVDTGTDTTLWYAVRRVPRHQVYLPIVLRAAESVEPVMVSLMDGEKWIPAGTPIILTIAWIADTPAFVADFLSSLDLTVTLDGDPLSDVMDYWGEIEEWGDYDEDGDIDYTSRWRYPVGVLSAGTHEVDSEFHLQWPVTDGFDLNGDGIPDEYSGAWEYSLRITVEK